MSEFTGLPRGEGNNEGQQLPLVSKIIICSTPGSAKVVNLSHFELRHFQNEI